MYLGELSPFPGKIGLAGGTCLSHVFSLGEVKLFAIFSLEEKNLPFGGLNLLLGEKSLFLEEHYLNLHVSFSLGGLNLPHGGVGLSTTFSLGGTNSSSREFLLPLGENFLSLENWLYYYIPCCIPFIEFLPDGGFVQTLAHSFFNQSSRTRQYLRTHTFLGESFPAFLNSINALRLKLVVLI